MAKIALSLSGGGFRAASFHLGVLSYLHHLKTPDGATLLDHVKKYNAQASGNIELKHYYRPIPLNELESVTNRTTSSATQDANGVLQYTSTAEGMWQNPGY